MKQVLKLIYRITVNVQRGLVKILVVPGLKLSLGYCGKHVKMSGIRCDIRPPENIYIDDYSQIGINAIFWTTRAKIHIGKYVLFGPNVSIITGDHRMDVIGKHICSITDEDKLPENDQDVVIKDGVWVGANVTILKGVIIGEDSIIAAGSIVTKNVEPYCLYGGVPAKKIKDRFSQDELERHKALLKE